MTPVDDDLVVDPASSGPKYPQHPEGSHAAVVVDVFNAGPRLKRFPGQPDKVIQEVTIVFRTHETKENGEPFDLARTFTKSFNEKANLRKFVESLTGKKLATDKKYDLRLLLPDPSANPPRGPTGALISVVHNQVGDKTYVNVASAIPLPKGMTPPPVGAYTRPAYFAERRAQHEAEVAKFEASQRFDPNEFEEVTEP